MKCIMPFIQLFIRAVFKRRFVISELQSQETTLRFLGQTSFLVLRRAIFHITVKISIFDKPKSNQILFFSRSCTDVICCLIFVICVFALFVLSVWGEFVWLSTTRRPLISTSTFLSSVFQRLSTATTRKSCIRQILMANFVAFKWSKNCDAFPHDSISHSISRPWELKISAAIFAIDSSCTQHSATGVEIKSKLGSPFLGVALKFYRYFLLKKGRID